ncbi:MAG: 7-cyano-7-deazaguanine synthase [Chitinivibrionia bacterium]|nr:7-cyano-7-deazaguanine synthase [Chitinivibrionia bacterium]
MRYERSEKRESAGRRFDERFIEILDQVRGKRPYDALVAYSGGKDSTYTLKLLKERYKLELLAVTVDQGFVSSAALENIKTVTERLDIDHYMVRPGSAALRALFRNSMTIDVYPVKALERASAICNSCMNVVKSLLIKMAVEMRIPTVVYGWSPGQAPLRSSVFKTNAPMLKKMNETTAAWFNTLVGDRLSGFLLEDRHFAAPEKDPYPFIIHPLAFLEYDERHILDEIRTLGWNVPEDTGSHSSNCLLNDFAIAEHLERFGFHPYAFEIAGLVREGCMAREEGLERLSARPGAAYLARVRSLLEGETE